MGGIPHIYPDIAPGDIMDSQNDIDPTHAVYAAVALDAFRRLFRELDRLERSVRATARITAAELYILQLLKDPREYTVDDLATASLAEKEDVDRIVLRLDSRNLIARHWSAATGKREEYRITEHGKRLLQETPAAPTMQLLDAFRKLSGTELYGLAIGLQRLQHEMGIAGGKARMLFT
jgi:DNA-binding MarR family transcriptional regulator